MRSAVVELLLGFVSFVDVFSVVNKDLTFKAKAKAKDLTSEHNTFKDRFRLRRAREHKTKKK